MNRARLFFYFMLFFLMTAGVRSAAAQESFVLNWSQIGFVNGVSAMQTFTDIDGSGVDMTIEFRVFDAGFDDLGLYIAGDTPLNEDMPKASEDETCGCLEVRDINLDAFPNAGYIQTRMVFSQDITINDLWLEPFYHWQNGHAMKNAALQAFNSDGAVVPISWTTYGGSQMVNDTHPGNGFTWWRSDFTAEQTTYSGAFDVDFGTQKIRELRWYSWGIDDETGELLNVVGSTLFGNFVFTVTPTAVSLNSLHATTNPPAMPIFLAILALGLVTLGITWRKETRMK
jgi:hypothetical protein